MASFMATGLALAIWLELRGDANPGSGAALWGDPGHFSAAGGPASRVGQLGGVMALLLLSAQLGRERRLGRMLALVALGILLGLTSQYLMAGARRGLGDLPVRRHALHLLALRRQADCPDALDRLGLWQLRVGVSPSLHGRQGAEPGHGADRVQPGSPPQRVFYWAVEGSGPMLGMVLMGGALLWRLSRAGWVRGAALLALVTPSCCTPDRVPFHHAIALWWALLLLLYAMDAEVEEQRPRQLARPSVPPWLLLRFMAIAIPLIVIPFMLTALHTAWVVTKSMSRAVTSSRRASARHRQSHGLADPGGV